MVQLDLLAQPVPRAQQASQVRLVLLGHLVLLLLHKAQLVQLAPLELTAQQVLPVLLA